MPEQSLMIAAIFIERITIVFSAFACVYFGWNLFRSNIYVGQDGNISIGEWKVELKSVGPGIFFSLFGSAILISAFLYPMKFSANEAVGGQVVSVSGLLPTADTDQMRFIRAVNTIGLIRDAIAAAGQPNVEPQAAVPILPIQATELVQAADRLDEFRNQLVANKFGGDNLKLWQANYKKFHDNQVSLDPAIRNKMVELDRTITPWMTNNMAGEAK
jgi:hypothetical protein